MQTMTSETWLTVGRFWFFKDRDDPDECTPFRFWCSECRKEFESFATPTQCPSGHKANDMTDRVMMTHKGYTAATFPFHTDQHRECKVSEDR